MGKPKLFTKSLSFLLALTVIFSLFALPLPALAVEAADAPDHVIINQVYGGSSDGSASHSFIQLYNPTHAAADLSTWSVQYRSSGDGSHNSEWQVCNLTGWIGPQGYYLIRCGATSSTATNQIPAGNQEWDIQLHNKGLSVALVNSQTKLSTEVKGDILTLDTSLTSSIVDLAAATGNDYTGGATETNQIAPAYEGTDFALKSGLQSKKKGIARTNFADTNDTAADFTVIDWSKSQTLPQAGSYTPPEEPETSTEINETTIWSYLDDNSDPAGSPSDAGYIRTGWTEESFDDSEWKTAAGTFGSKKGSSDLGNGFTAGTILAGCDGSDNYTTYYFRTTLHVDSLKAFNKLVGSVVYDDGVIVYLNGQRIAAGDDNACDESGASLNKGFDANGQYGGSNASDPKTLNISLSDLSALKEGDNVVAVELHNGRKTSSDVYFAMPELKLTYEELTAVDLTIQPGRDETEVNLNWYAAAGTEHAMVRYGAGDAEPVTVKAELTTANVAAEAGETVVCRATLTGLGADTAYTYAISNDGGETWTKDYTFTTPGTEDFTFAFVGDPQLKNGNQDGKSAGVLADGSKATNTTIAQGWADTLSALADCDVNFIASAGDQVDTTGGNEWEYTSLFAPEEMQTLPFAAAVGNHDRHINFLDHYNLPNVQDVDSIVNSETTEAAKEATTAYGNYYYQYNNALFVVLNDSSYPASVEQAEPYIQAFEQTLKAATTACTDYDWLFVQHHKSTESVAQHVADRDIQYYVEAGFEKLMDKYQVDFVLAGHDHVYARSYAMYDGQRVTDATDNLTNPQGTVYITCNTGSGLKYYGIFSSSIYVKDNEAYPYLANGKTGSQEYLKNVLPLSTDVAVQNYIPGYTIIRVDGNETTFTTYATYGDGNGHAAGSILDSFTVTKTGDAETRTQGMENEEAALKLELAARYDSGVKNKDGGSTEIVQYNEVNGFAYAVNGTTGNLAAIGLSNMTDGETVDTLNAIHIPVREIVEANSKDFTYGDMTSVAVSPDGKTLAAAIQAEGYADTGRVALFACNADGTLTFEQLFTVGVQPDMVTFTPDGTKILTADEGEPRMGYTGAVDPAGSVSVITVGSGTVTTVGFAGYDAASARAALAEAGIVLKKETNPSVDLEPEYIACSNTTAYVSLQEANAIAVLNLADHTWKGIYSAGFEDYAKVAVDIDKSDGKYEAKTYENLKGIRMPDGICLMTIGGTDYILTANEGDSRAWPVETEADTNERKGKTSPSGKITMPEKVTWFQSGQYDGLELDVDYLFGGRSFTMFRVTDTGLEEVFDSGSDFERKTAEYLPEYFNCSNDDLGVEDRSGKKGPEPETVVTGTVGNKTYAFVTLERIGGVMVYDITNPVKVSYVNYINSRDFTGADENGVGADDSPEGLCFVPAPNSPTDKALLLAACEVGGTVAAYEMTGEKESNPSGGSTAYAVAVSSASNGKVTASTTSASKGTIVTLTVSPDDGYALSALTVTDAGGSTLTLTDKGDGRYTFTMPASRVTVSAAFKEAVHVCPAEKYTDVDTTAWYHEAVDYAIENGLMQGYSADQFGPNDQLSRAQLCQILCNKEGKPVVDYAMPYEDVDGGAWYAEAIRWATSEGLVGGYGNGRFGPEDSITREQIATILYRYAGSPETYGSLDGFADKGEVLAYAETAMKWAVESGIICGKGDGCLDPQGSATRAEVAAMLERYCAWA